MGAATCHRSYADGMALEHPAAPYRPAKLKISKATGVARPGAKTLGTLGKPYSKAKLVPTKPTISRG